MGLDKSLKPKWIKYNIRCMGKPQLIKYDIRCMGKTQLVEKSRRGMRKPPNWADTTSSAWRCSNWSNSTVGTWEDQNGRIWHQMHWEAPTGQIEHQVCGLTISLRRFSWNANCLTLMVCSPFPWRQLESRKKERDSSFACVGADKNLCRKAQQHLMGNWITMCLGACPN